MDEYLITVSGGSAENYKFNYDNTGKLTITPSTGGTLYITGSGNTVRVNDIFTLHAFYGNSTVNVTWGLSSDSPADVVTIDQNGRVTAKKAGTVTITATAGANYGNAAAAFELTVKQTGITLTPTGLVKTYTGERQDISFAAHADFTPVLSGEGKNVDVTYTLISDPTVTEPIQAGTYSVAYTITDGSYTGGGTATMYINKATVAARLRDAAKAYGDEFTDYELEITNYGALAENVRASTLDEIKALITYSSDGAARNAVVKEGGYEMIPTPSTSETDNVKFTVEKGTLTVSKAPLTIKLKDVTREIGAENPTLEAEYTGFVNEETKDVLTGELVLAYDESITSDTVVGTYEDKTTASGVTADNYDITFETGDVTITKIAVKASAEASRADYLAVRFDKAVEGLDVNNFVVKNGDNIITLTSVEAASNNKTYTLNGTFTVDTEYTVEILYTGETQEITEGQTLTITPAKASSGGSSGGGGGGSSSGTTSYTVTFETNGGSTIDKVKVTKNKTAAEPAEPTKDGYVFDGWYTDSAFTAEYAFDTKVTKNITLYAKWLEDEVQEPSDAGKGDEQEPITDEWKNPFSDVSESDWFYESVKHVNENGLMSGTASNEFAPNESITRGMLVTVLWRTEGQPQVNYAMPFTDVIDTAYYAEAVRWAASENIVNGISETEFAPNENITREQIAAIMFRYAKYKGYDVSVGEETNILSYADFNEISEYAVEAMQYAVGSGLMKGKTETTLNPKDSATRAEIAAILQRFIEANK